MLELSTLLQFIIFAFFLWSTLNGPFSQSIFTKYAVKDKLNKDDLSDIKISIQKREKEIISSNLKDINYNYEFSDVLKKLQLTIDYLIKRHDWYEDQRYRNFGTTITIASIFVTVAGISARSQVSNGGNPDIFTKCIFITFCIVCFFSITRAVFLYNIELDADRPYRLVSDVRHYYYVYNMPEPINKNGNKYTDIANIVCDKRNEFINRITENFDGIESTREDIEQIFILQTLQMHKSRSLKKMRNNLSSLLIFGALEIALYIAYTVVNA